MVSYYSLKVLTRIRITLIPEDNAGPPEEEEEEGTGDPVVAEGVVVGEEVEADGTRHL